MKVKFGVLLKNGSPIVNSSKSAPWDAFGAGSIRKKSGPEGPPVVTRPA
jgi:hypothetical protein